LLASLASLTWADLRATIVVCRDCVRSHTRTQTHCHTPFSHIDAARVAAAENAAAVAVTLLTLLALPTLPNSITRLALLSLLTLLILLAQLK
jgi:hypothetical protein